MIVCVRLRRGFFVCSYEVFAVCGKFRPYQDDILLSFIPSDGYSVFKEHFLRKRAGAIDTHSQTEPRASSEAMMLSMSPALIGIADYVGVAD